jgi:hypothetical protein
MGWTRNHNLFYQAQLIHYDRTHWAICLINRLSFVLYIWATQKDELEERSRHISFYLICLPVSEGLLFSIILGFTLYIRQKTDDL